MSRPVNMKPWTKSAVSRLEKDVKELKLRYESARKEVCKSRSSNGKTSYTHENLVSKAAEYRSWYYHGVKKLMKAKSEI